MLYGEFKSRFKKESEPILGEYVIEDTRKQESQHNKKPKRKISFFKKFFIFVLVLVIIVCSALLACDFLLPDGLNTVFALFEKEADYYYTLIWGSYDTLKEARTQADGLKLQGGAGYIYYDGKYRVFLSYYPDKVSADSVALKGNYELYPIVKSTIKITDTPLSQREEIRELIGIENEILAELYDVAAQLENGTSATDCAMKITTLSKRIEKKCQLLFESNTVNAKMIKLRQALKIALSALNNLSSDKITTTYLSDIREAAILIAFAFSAT